ncbi:MAG: hypothetical protein QOD69_451 [Solirubrobacteraceae bacterium]|nr:hypothetical protein [Solirubrobacteraceae bacterium]
MNRIQTHLLTAAAAGAVLASATAAQAAQAAPTTLATEQAPTRVAAWNGTAMWSHYDPATKAYALVKSVDGGPPTAVGVAPRSDGPFDVDLGTNRTGATYAVYTRGGDIYRLRVATGAETRIDKLSSPTLAERDPTIQRGRIAFIRRDGGFDQLRVGDTTSGTTGSTLVVKRPSIASAELGSQHVAYVEELASEFGELRVHIRNLVTGADRQVYRAASGGANEAGVTRPTYVDAPAAFVWARTNLAAAGSRIVRYTLRGSRLGYAPGDRHYNSTAWAGTALGVLTTGSLDAGESQGSCTDGDENYCTVALTGPLRFGAKP